MAELLKFFGEHPFLAFMFMCGVYYVILAVLWYIPNRVFSTIKVIFRGWPPEHLDADGDWKPVDKTKDVNP